MVPPLSTAGYDNVIVIDTQVVLEARPLDQLPWADLFSGPTLLLVCRQVQSEIDAKKSDGRLGKRARAFNKLLDTFIEARVPTTVLSTPLVDVALLANTRIDWEVLDDLDPDDGDDRIVAQALYAKVDDRSGLTVLSHDMRPRDGALTHGLLAVKLPESWLRAPDPSPHERRTAELEERLRILSADQPQISVRLEAATPEPWVYLSVEAATPHQTEKILDARLAEAPAASSRGAYDFGSTLYDPTHADRLEDWREELSEDIPLIHKGLTRLHSQQRVRVIVEYVGSMSAEGLSIEIRSGNATLHALPYWVLVGGASAPEPRYLLHHGMDLGHHNLLPRHREQFAFYWDQEGPGDHVIISCASFRQAKSYELEVSVELVPASLPKLHVEAIVTATNMKGEARQQLIIPVEAQTATVDDLYDPSDGSLMQRPPFDIPDYPEAEDFIWCRNNGLEFKHS